jgi:hypothetical protein
MPLLVDAPAANERERRYVLNVVLADWLGLDWRLRIEDRPDVRIRISEHSTRRVLMPDVLLATPRERWLTASSLPRTPIQFATVGHHCDAFVPGDRLPVLYGSTASAPELIAFGSEGAQLRVDVFGSAFFMLTRYEELALPAHDRYGRFPASSSIAARGGFLGIPIVDAYVELLWTALQRIWPGLRRRSRAYRVALSHDVDIVPMTLGQPTGNALQIARDIRGCDLRMARRRAGCIADGTRGDRLNDPCDTFDFLMDASERNGLGSAFYFLSRLKPGLRDGNYRIDHPGIRSLIRHIHDRGHEIGFHASFNTFRDAALTNTEFRRLREVAQGQGVETGQWGGRQHYLRWANPVTWRNWDDAGLHYDATVGFAEQVGFRAGTCHPYRVFDLERRRPLKLREHPFHVMDVTLFEYMALDPEAAFKQVLDIARQCRRFRGSLGLLWHNGTLPTPQRKAWYESMVASVNGGSA